MDEEHLIKSKALRESLGRFIQAIPDEPTSTYLKEHAIHNSPSFLKMDGIPIESFLAPGEVSLINSFRMKEVRGRIAYGWILSPSIMPDKSESNDLLLPAITALFHFGPSRRYLRLFKNISRYHEQLNFVLYAFQDEGQRSSARLQLENQQYLLMKIHLRLKEAEQLLLQQGWKYNHLKKKILYATPAQRPSEFLTDIIILLCHELREAGEEVSRSKGCINQIALCLSPFFDESVLDISKNGFIDNAISKYRKLSR